LNEDVDNAQDFIRYILARKDIPFADQQVN
jgi:hypothetical protein